MTDGAILEFASVQKAYGGLRPLRLTGLSIARGERIALGGIDAMAAEALVNLVTGAALPEQGEVRVAGASTAAIADGEAWLASLDRFGIISERAVLLEGSTLLQNLALPLSLEIDAISPEVKRRVEALSREVGLEPDRLATPVAQARPDERARVQAARALALEPEILLLEHPTARLPRDAASAYGQDLAAVVAARGITALAITEDPDFAKPFATRWLTVKGATGEVVPARPKWRLFG